MDDSEPLSWITLFVEGDDDKLFAERIIVPTLRARWSIVQIYPYAEETKEKVAAFIKTLDQIPGASYVFFTDLDEQPCATSRKAAVVERRPYVDPSRVVVVKRCIESWYLAGVTEKGAKRLRLRRLADVEVVRKAEFNSLIPARWSRLTLMSALPEDWSREEALARASSYEHVDRRYLR